MSSIIRKDDFPYAFDLAACEPCGGRCCIGESGNIFVTPSEIEKIIQVLNIDVAQFYKEYLIKKAYKFSLQEKKVGDSYDCIFFERENGGCRIYEARPMQCRTFPFWDYYKNRVEELKRECPGILDD
ncbi:MAG: YkgJ family cysteine cluster protein [Campylobacterota bacterium]|nr:YkgJ family cysteine cluster protein [Campylobacterota bacterium]